MLSTIRIAHGIDRRRSFSVGHRNTVKIKTKRTRDLLSAQTRAKSSYWGSTGHLSLSMTACINNNYYCYWFCLATKPINIYIYIHNCGKEKKKKIKHCQIIFKINLDDDESSEKHNILLFGNSELTVLTEKKGNSSWAILEILFLWQSLRKI